MDICSGADAGQDSLFLGKTAGHGKGFIIRDRDDLINDIEVEVAGNKPCPGSLDLVRTGLHGFTCLGLSDDGRVFGLHSDGLEARLACLQGLGDAGDRAACANC